MPPQSRQSAKLFLQSLELGLPQPLTRRRVCPPPLIPGGVAHSLAREGVGESQFRRGDIHCGNLYMYVLCVCPLHSFFLFKSEPVVSLSPCKYMQRQRIDKINRFPANGVPTHKSTQTVSCLRII